MAGVDVGWGPRFEPLAACACIARGELARALGRALLSWDATRLSRVQACAGEGALVVLADEAELPWLDGVVYLGRDVNAPHLLLPTSRGPDVPVELFARALAARVPDPARAAAVLPDERGGVVWVPTTAAGPIDRDVLEAWVLRP